MEAEIVFEDQAIIVLKKQAGVPVQTRRIGEKDLVSMLKNYLFEKNPEKGEPYLGVVHRLDQPVEGVLVFAKTPAAARELSTQTAQKTMQKYYLAVICAQPAVRQGRLENYLKKDSRKNCSSVVPKGTAEAKAAQLKYELMDWREGLGLVRIQLLTGRHHQIRVQMAHAGMPLWGDTKYNREFTENREGQSVQVALCACCLEFRHPISKQLVRYEVKPVNKIFQKFV